MAARPIKSDDQKFTCRLETTWTKAQMTLLKFKASWAGMRPLEFIRNRVLGVEPEKYLPTPEQEAMIKGLDHFIKIGEDLDRALNVPGVDVEGVNRSVLGIEMMCSHLIKKLENASHHR